MRKRKKDWPIPQLIGSRPMCVNNHNDPSFWDGPTCHECGRLGLPQHHAPL